MIKVLYFARLRESLGMSEEEIELTGAISIAGLMARLKERGGAWEKEFNDSSRVRAAINQELAKSDSQVSDGDEVAFFPPVTGG